MFQIAFRLALPVISVLLVAEFALVLLGKIEQHLQLSHMLFSLKTLGALAILATLMSSSALASIEQWLGSGWRVIQSTVGLVGWPTSNAMSSRLRNGSRSPGRTDGFRSAAIWCPPRSC